MKESGSGKRALVGAGVGPWHLQEGVIAQHRPCVLIRPPPGCFQVHRVGHLLILCLVKHSQCGNLPSVLQAVPHCWLSCCCCCLPLLLLLLLLLLLMLLPLPRLLMSWQVGSADEAFCPLLHQIKMAAGTGHPGERRVFSDRLDLSLVQG